MADRDSGALKPPDLGVQGFEIDRGFSVDLALPSKTVAARPSNCVFHWVIFVGCTLKCVTSSDRVLLPFTAANATLARKAGYDYGEYVYSWNSL